MDGVGDPRGARVAVRALHCRRASVARHSITVADGGDPGT